MLGQMGLDSEPLARQFTCRSHRAPSAAMVVMLCDFAGDPGVARARRPASTAALDRNLPIENLRPFEKTLGATLERRRFSTLLLTSFAALAMILAGVGHLWPSELLGKC